MDTILYLIFVFVIIVFSMVLHELAHGYVAYWLGDDTAKNDGRLSLNPLRHIDPVMTIFIPLLLALTGMPVFGGAKPVPVNSHKVRGAEWGFALVALAGPLTNFILAFIFFLIGYFSGAFMSDGSILDTFCVAGVSVNLGFCVFNLLPIPPLDGSRILYALAPDFVRNFMRAMEGVGVIVIYCLLLLCGGLFSNYMSMAMNGIWQFFCFLVGAA